MNSWSKRIFILSSFFSPFYFILPTNFSIYEILLLSSFTLLVFEEKKLRYPKFITLSLLILLGGYTLSVLTAVNKIEAVKLPIQFTFILVVLFGLIFTHIESTRDLQLHLRSLLLTLLVHMVFFSYKFINIGIPRGRYRYSLFYSNPNHLSQVLVLLIGSSAIYLYFQKQRGVLWYLSLLSVVSSIAPLVLTLSRSGMLSLVMLLFILGVTELGKVNNMKKLLLRGGAISIAGTISFIILYITNTLPTGIMIRISETLSGSGLSDRIIPWRVVARNYQEFLFTGSGYNNYELIVSNLMVMATEQGYTIKPHNIFLISFAEGGTIALVGILLFFTYFVYIFTPHLLEEKSENERFLFSAGLLLFPYLFVRQFGTLTTHRFFWLYTALSMVSVYLLCSNTATNQKWSNKIIH